MPQEFKGEVPIPNREPVEETPKRKEGENTLSIEYLTGLWNLSREQVLEKILKDRLPYDLVNDQIRVSSGAVPVGGK